MSSADFIMHMTPNWSTLTNYRVEETNRNTKQSTSSIIDDLAAQFEGKMSIPRQETTVMQQSTSPLMVSGQGTSMLQRPGAQSSTLQTPSIVMDALEAARNTWTNTPIRIPVAERALAETVYVPPLVTKARPRVRRTKKV